jgi:hypothetical protein
MKERKGFFGYVVLIIACGAISCLTTGCSGIELGGRLGVYRVDERQESQRTYRRSVPLKCYFTSCAPEGTEGEERQGS